MLSTRRFGTGPEVVALHGFSLTGEQFSQVAEPLDRTVVAPDLPGHGMSAAEPSDLSSVLVAIHDLLTAFREPLPLIGYSQGGRMALLTAIEHESDVAALVLISASPGIQDEADRRTRAEEDRALAKDIRRMGIDRFIAEWTSSALTSTRHLSAEQRRWDRSVRETNTPEGLVSALTGYGLGSQPNAWDRLNGIAIPVLVMAGSTDQHFVAIAEEMAHRIPGAELQIIRDAGHNPLADQPDSTIETVSRFLDRDGRA